MTRMPNRRALHRWGVALALTGLVGGSVPALAAPRPVSEIVMDARDGSVLLPLFAQMSFDQLDTVVEALANALAAQKVQARALA